VYLLGMFAQADTCTILTSSPEWVNVTGECIGTFGVALPAPTSTAND